MLVIVDYHTGNLGSIRNMLRRIGTDATVSSDPEVIAEANKLILPGVGAFDAGMASLERLGLIPVLNRKVAQERVPILGICLGMQLFARSSEEGRRDGLGWLDATTVRFKFPDSPPLRVPHMGWNRVVPTSGSGILSGLPDNPRFYFVHSYHLVCASQSDILGTTEYGYPFAAAVQHANILGTQFHPEKSLKWGMAVLRNFAHEPALVAASP